jgi:hypothetical protein
VPSVLPVSFNPSIYTLAVGPQFDLRTSRPITPFIRAGFGYIHQSIVVPVIHSNMADHGAFYGAGGGFDFAFGHTFALRATADYARTHLFGGSQNNIRVSLGLLLRMGKLK